MVSNLYLYTNTPPHRYGSQAPKVAETINRAYDFNKKTQRRELHIGNYVVERTHWEKEDGTFPFLGTHGNFDAYHVKAMTIAYMQQNIEAIRTAASETIQSTQNSDPD